MSEAWLIDTIQKQEVQPVEAYDVVSDLAPEGRGYHGIRWIPVKRSLNRLMRSLKMYGKRGVHKDSKLQEEGSVIFEKDGILYNCALSGCDMERDLNE